MTAEELATAIVTHTEIMRGQGEALGRIEAKVDKTNGRVTSLELWKAKMIGAWVVVSFAGPVITGLVIAKFGGG